MKSVSVIIPVYNESKTILQVLGAVISCQLANTYIQEIVVIDDASTDGTIDILKQFNHPLVRCVYKDKNEGKGASLQIGFMESKGDIVIIQDGDLEYNPTDFQKLLDPILNNNTEVVYGSRFLDKRKWGEGMVIWRLANFILTVFSNLLTGFKLTDMETCYKVFNRQVVDRFKGKLISNQFEIEPELTAWISYLGFKITEIPISYIGRSKAHGKKIGWRDGFRALWAIFYFKISLR